MEASPFKVGQSLLALVVKKTFSEQIRFNEQGTRMRATVLSPSLVRTIVRSKVPQVDQQRVSGVGQEGSNDADEERLPDVDDSAAC